jgi:CRISPR/Cas system-associated exonuclease Cas4 (RecB family)
MPIDFKKAFSESVLGNQREWEHDRSKSVGASEVFGCIRQSYYKKREPDRAEEIENPLDSEWGHMERGNLIENFYAVPNLRRIFDPKNCFYMGEEQRTLIVGNLSATPDGIVVDQPPDALAGLPGGVPVMDGDQIAIEVKTFNPQYMDIQQAKARHIGQNIVQMGAFADTTNYAPKHGVVLYINPVNLKDVRAYATKFDPKLYQRAKDRADDVFDLTKSARDYKPEGKINGDCEYCPFQYACAQDSLAAFPKKAKKAEELDPDVQLRITDLGERIRTLREELKEIEAAKKDAEESLRMILNDHDTNRFKVDGMSVTYSSIAGRRTLDTDAVLNYIKHLEECIDNLCGSADPQECGANFKVLDDLYKEGAGHTRLTVK